MSDFCNYSGKICYEHKSDAVAAAAAVNRRGGGAKSTVYVCEHCTRYHIGRPNPIPTKIRKKVRAAALRSTRVHCESY